MKKVLFIDRDGVLLIEPPIDYQVDSFEKLKFYPKVFSGLGKIANELYYELVMVTNQDGLGTKEFTYESFIGPQTFMIDSLASEGIIFSDVCIDRTFPSENADTRKPRTGLLKKYLNGEYDLGNSFVIGDRITDMELAKNLGAKGIFMSLDRSMGENESSLSPEVLSDIVELETCDWEEIYTFLKLGSRTAELQRNTNETKIHIKVNLDGTGKTKINTGIAFFDHMLDQLGRHGQMDLDIQVKGDL